jgi:hypothetical protein
MLILTPLEAEEHLQVTFAAWNRGECDFVASTAKAAEAADRAIVSAGKCCHTARSDGRDLAMSGLVGTARREMPAHRTKGDLAEQ